MWRHPTSGSPLLATMQPIRRQYVHSKEQGRPIFLVQAAAIRNNAMPLVVSIVFCGSTIARAQSLPAIYAYGPEL